MGAHKNFSKGQFQKKKKSPMATFAVVLVTHMLTHIWSSSQVSRSVKLQIFMIIKIVHVASSIRGT